MLGGRFVARDRVQLTFSEPLAPTKLVNPRQFRLSSAYSTTDYQAGYASGYYYDLGGNDSYQPPIFVNSLESYEGHPEVLTLQLNRPVPVDVCLAIRERQATIVSNQGVDGSTMRARTGVFLHYTSRGSEGVRDRAQNPLGDIGGEWALNFGARQRNAQGTVPTSPAVKKARRPWAVVLSIAPYDGPGTMSLTRYASWPAAMDAASDNVTIVARRTDEEPGIHSSATRLRRGLSVVNGPSGPCGALR